VFIYKKFVTKSVAEHKALLLIVFRVVCWKFEEKFDSCSWII